MKRIVVSGTNKKGKRECRIYRNETIDDQITITKAIKKLTDVTIKDFE